MDGVASTRSLRQADGLCGKKRYPEALAVIDQALLGPDGGRRVELLTLKARVLSLNLKRPLEGLEPIEAAYRLAPDNRDILALLARVRHLAGASVAAFSAYKRLWRAGDPSKDAAEHLFAILMERKRYEPAGRLATVVEDREPMSGALARDLADLAVARRDPKTAKAAIERIQAPPSVSGLAQARLVVRSLGAELAAGDTMAGYRHLAIGGAAYCGSTTLGVILGSTPGFAFAGETHWLTDTREADGLRGSITETSLPLEKWPIACRVCARNCQYFDVPFRLGLAADATGWYAKIADRLDVKNLVTSDKNVPIYSEKDPLFRFDYVLSYKTPVNFLRSLFKQQLRRPDWGDQVTPQWAASVLDRWAATYLAHLRVIRPTGRRVVFNWDGFVADPDQHIRRFASLLDIPIEPDVLGRIRLGHFIGGNIGVDVRGLRQDSTLVVRPSDAPELPPEIHEIAAAHESSQRVARILLSEYRRDFPGLAAT